MKKVTKYQSRDGKLFDTPEECQAHENKLIDQRRSAVYDIAVEMLLEQKPSVLSCLNNLVVNLLKTKL